MSTLKLSFGIILRKNFNVDTRLLHRLKLRTLISSLKLSQIDGINWRVLIPEPCSPLHYQTGSHLLRRLLSDQWQRTTKENKQEVFHGAIG